MVVGFFFIYLLYFISLINLICPTPDAIFDFKISIF